MNQQDSHMAKIPGSNPNPNAKLWDQLDRMEERDIRIEQKLNLLLEKTGKIKRVTVIDADFRARMTEEFGDLLGGQKEVDHQIDLGMAHKSHANYPGKQMNIKNWLKSAVEYRQATQPAQVARNSGTRDKYLKDYARRWADKT